MQYFVTLPRLVRRVVESPDSLDDLTPREFEELVAELLAGHGWEVSLTPQTRDGGYDILGISRDATGFELSWAVECKHYRSDRKVGVDVLRGLYGVKESLGFSQSVLVTSSTITAEAKRFAQTHPGIQLVDRGTLLQWFVQYKPRRSSKAYVADKTFYSCFVSHSHHDEPFVEALVTRLKGAGIRVWFAPEDLVAGKKIHEEVFRAITLFDKVLLVISKHSMNSTWVKTEVRRARNREISENRRVLFPISLVSIDEIRNWQLFDADNGQDLAVEIREYLIPDFSDWKSPASFEKQFTKVVAGLRAAAYIGNPPLN